MRVMSCASDTSEYSEQVDEKVKFSRSNTTYNVSHLSYPQILTASRHLRFVRDLPHHKSDVKTVHVSVVHVPDLSFCVVSKDQDVDIFPITFS